MKTLLEAVNEILLASGERQVEGIGSYPSIKAKLALESSLKDISVLQDWIWLKKATPAISWDLDVATLPPIQRLLQVTYPRPWDRQRQELRLCPPDLYPWYEAIPGTPREYLYVDSYHVRVNPYPTTPDQQQDVIFHYIAIPVFPSDNDVFPIPDELYELLKRGALYHFTLMHLDDPNTAMVYKGQFDELSSRIVVRQPSRTIGSSNMYRRRG